MIYIDALNLINRCVEEEIMYEKDGGVFVINSLNDLILVSKDYAAKDLMDDIEGQEIVKEALKKVSDVDYTLLEVHEDYISINDRDFDSSISFDKTLMALKEAYRESPEYFSKKVIIEAYSYIMLGEFLYHYQVIGEIEASITGRGAHNKIRKLYDLVGDGYEWLDYSEVEQRNIVSSSIINILKNI